MVGPSASTGSPEYLITEHEGEPVWKRRPLEMYYRPRPTEVHKEMVTCLELFLRDESWNSYTNDYQDFELMNPQRPPSGAAPGAMSN